MRAYNLLSIVIFAFHVILLSAQEETNCPPGQVFMGQACKPCPAGTYRIANTTNTCVKCRIGTFNPIEGVGTRRLCLFCPFNTFSDEVGSVRCKRCPEGTVAARGASICQACGPGFRLSSKGCEPCPKGTYNDKNTSLECEQCPFPLISPLQSTSRSSCRPCPAGKFGRSGLLGGCEPCLEGSFKPGRAGLCRDCPPGSVAKPGSIACKKCPAGTFSGTFQEKCERCAKGTTSNGPGATRCRVIGAARCPKGTFENANGDCDRCREGFFYNKNRKRCDPCPSGSISKGGLRTRCKICPPGLIAQESFPAVCRCPGELFKRKGTCKPCPAGTWGNISNLPGRGGCDPCQAGFFSKRGGKCKPCPIGMFSKKGAKRCERCPSGSVANPLSLSAFRGSTRCVSIATGCPLGTQLGTDVFDRRVCRRVDCPVGTPDKDIGIKCRPCSPGSRLVGERCRKCPIDSVSDGGVITSCRKCTNGLFRSFFDASKCSCDGPRGEGKGIQGGVCKDCPPGSAGDVNAAECTECPLGQFASGFGNGLCKSCPRGTFSDVKGATSCKTCPEGQIPEKLFQSTSCVPTI